MKMTKKYNQNKAKKLNGSNKVRLLELLLSWLMEVNLISRKNRLLITSQLILI